jgi:fatty acid desaturase
MQSSTIILSDPGYTSSERHNRINAFFISLLNDKRDLPFIHLSLLMLFTTVPAAVLFFLPGVLNWWLAILYFLFNSIFLMGPYILMLHNVSHRRLFKRKYRFLNVVIPWIVGPFYGETPETYFAHHIGMHHTENNLDDDLSSTMKSQRDSFRDFMKYFLHFFFLGIPALFLYMRKRNRKKILRKMVAGELCYLFLTLLLLVVNWKATIVVFIFPVIFTRFMMMTGNWAQHAFIDMKTPENNFRNSITCINSRYNRTCWNDGYHIGHHFYPSLHWTEMPEEFSRNIDHYRQEGAIVFRRLDYFMIWLLLMTKSYKTLARHYVELDMQNPKSEAEIIRLLKSRTQKETAPA